MGQNLAYQRLVFKNVALWGWLYYQQELSRKLLCVCSYCLSMNIQNESYVLIGTCIEKHNQIKGWA